MVVTDANYYYLLLLLLLLLLFVEKMVAAIRLCVDECIQLYNDSETRWVTMMMTSSSVERRRSLNRSIRTTLPLSLSITTLLRHLIS